MQPVAVAIPGAYYDSYLVSDRLFLMSHTGWVSTYSWPQIVDALTREHPDPLLRVLLQGSQEYTQMALSPILSDLRFRELAKDRLREVAETEIVVDPSILRAALIAEQQLPLEFPYASFEVVGGTAYVAGSSGVYGLSVKRGLKNLFSTRPATRFFDSPAFHMNIGWESMIVSAGDKGLYDIPLFGDREEKAYDAFVTRHGWIGASLYAHSPDPKRSAFLVYTISRDLAETKSEEELLGNVDTSWGEYDRICGLTGDRLKVRRVRFESFNPGPVIHDPMELTVPLTSPFVSAANSSFGTVIESAREFIVVDSEMQASRLEIEPINWRLYKRGRYNGFLSVALDDRMVNYVFPDMWFPTETIGRRSVAPISLPRVRRRAA